MPPVIISNCFKKSIKEFIKVKRRKTLRKLMEKKELLVIKATKSANTIQIMKKEIIPFYSDHLNNKR